MAAAIGTGIACTGGPASTGDVLPSSGGTSTSSSGLTSTSSSGTSGVSSTSGTPTGPTNVADNGAFSKVCAIDNDCVAVYFGDTCGFCNLANGSIAQSAEAAYQVAYNNARNNCPPSHIAGSCAQQYSVVRCNTGSHTCEFDRCNNIPVDTHHCTDAGF
jgi:hypothetical protein